jgi:hypothetical protein
MPQNYEDRLVRTALRQLGIAESRIEQVLSWPHPEVDMLPFLEAAEES